MASGLDKGCFRYEADDLGSRHLQASFLCRPADLIECHMEWGSVDVSYVHGYLGYAVFLNEPADSLASLESAGNHHGLSVYCHRTTFFAYLKCDGIRLTD